MNSRIRLHTVGLLFVSTSLALCARASAATSDPFEGKTIVIEVAGTSGGGIDIGARLLAPFLHKYLPAHPSVIVQEMPGAGGVRALEYLAGPAPKDGTRIAAFASGPLLAPLLGPQKVDFPIDQFTAIGALDNDNGFCTTWYKSPVKTLAEARKRTVTVAGTGAGSDTDTEPVVLNAVLGTKFKVITGYLGTKETALAVERGEVDGRCGFGLNSIRATEPGWLKDHKLNFIVQMGLKPNPAEPNVPLALNLVHSPEKKAMVSLMSAPLAIAHPYLGPPGMDKAAAAELRKAFMQSLRDPTLRAQFAKASGGAEPQPTDGTRMQRILADMQATPKSVVKKLRALISPNHIAKTR